MLPVALLVGGVFVGAAYTLLAVVNAPILFALALALVLAVLSAVGLQSGVRHPRGKAIFALAVAAAVLIGVPLVAVSHQTSQQADNRARFSGLQAVDGRAGHDDAGAVGRNRSQERCDS